MYTIHKINCVFSGLYITVNNYDEQMIGFWKFTFSNFVQLFYLSKCMKSSIPGFLVLCSW
jgi:hypothetical protein